MYLFLFYLTFILILIGIAGFPLCLALRKRGIYPWIFLPTIIACLYLLIAALFVAHSMFSTKFGPGGGGGEFMVPIIGLVATGVAILSGIGAFFVGWSLRRSMASARQWTFASALWLTLVIAMGIVVEVSTRQVILITVVDLKGRTLPGQLIFYTARELYGFGDINATAVTDSNGHVRLSFRTLESLLVGFDQYARDNHYTVLQMNRNELGKGVIFNGFNASTLVRMGIGAEGMYRGDPRIKENMEWALPPNRILQIELPRGDEEQIESIHWPGIALETFISTNIPHTSYPRVFPKAFNSTTANTFLPDILRMQSGGLTPEDRDAGAAAMDVLHRHNAEIKSALARISDRMAAGSASRPPSAYVSAVEELAKIFKVPAVDQNTLATNMESIERAIEANDAIMSAALGRPFR